MSEIVRSDINEEWAHSGIVEAGDFAFINYCVGNIGQPIENQINGAFDHLEVRLKSIGLTLESVVKIDCLFRDVWNIPVLEKVIKERFNGKSFTKINTNGICSPWRRRWASIPT